MLKVTWKFGKKPTRDWTLLTVTVSSSPSPLTVTGVPAAVPCTLTVSPPRRRSPSGFDPAE